MNQQLSMVSGYLGYRIRTVSRFDLHSPFAYAIWSKVLTDRQHYPGYDPVETLRARLLKDCREITTSCFGAKATEAGLKGKTVAVKDIVRNSAVSQKYGRLLFRLSKHFHPATILEIGTSAGISASYLASGNAGSRVITLEGCPETLKIAEENFRKLNLSNILAVQGEFDSMLQKTLEKTGTVDLAFIDGNHREGATLDYFRRLLPYLGPDAVLVFDDIHWSAGMRSAWRQIKADASVKVTFDLYRFGLVFFRDGLSKEDFTIRF
jgi:predicted O-methyltransferase YrrM